MSAERPPSRLLAPFTRSRQRGDVMVIGLGRFGATLAVELESLGHNVFGVDLSEDIAQRYRDQLTDVVAADTTTEESLRQLGATEFETVVVAIGTSVEDSVLTTAALVDLKIPTIWARAITVAHAKILERIGAHQVVQPDRDEARRVAHRVATGHMIEFVGLDEHFALVEVEAPRLLLGRTLADADIRNRFNVTVVCIKPVGGMFTYATADTVVGPGDLLVVAGETEAAERFASLK